MTLLAQSGQSSASLLNVKQQADQLVTVTRPGYYQALLIPDWRRSQANRQLAFTTAARLCTFADKPVQSTRSLTGERLNERQVQLSWVRANESTGEPVNIERSFDGVTGFETVGWLPVAEHSESQGQLIDANTHSAYSYYRLRWTTTAGQFETSPLIAIPGVEVRLTVKAFPNPGPAASLQFEVVGLSERAVSVMIYDVQGHILYQNKSVALDESSRFAFPATLGLPAGRYFVRVLTNTQPVTTAFLLEP